MAKPCHKSAAVSGVAGPVVRCVRSPIAPRSPDCSPTDVREVPYVSRRAVGTASCIRLLAHRTTGPATPESCADLWHGFAMGPCGDVRAVQCFLYLPSHQHEHDGQPGSHSRYSAERAPPLPPSRRGPGACLPTAPYSSFRRSLNIDVLYNFQIAMTVSVVGRRS